MTATARAIRLERPEHAELVDVALPAPGPGEVLVEVAAAGLCGSDVELYEGRRPAGYATYPIVPGHEWAGSIAALGDGADSFEVRDPVIAEGIRRCGRCTRCREGATNLCLATYAETGFTHPGGFSDYVLVPVDLLHGLPHGADLEAAALLEPAACVAAGLMASPPAPGARVAVIGAGTLGLLATMMARLHSPAELVVVDPRDDRREIALRLGATAAMASPSDGALNELEADLVIEAAGAGTTLPAALGAARRGGSVIVLGISGRGEVALDPDLVSVGHLEVRGVFGAPSAAWQHVVGLFAAGLLDTRELISHRLGLEGYGDALELVGKPGTGKVLLLPGGDG